ncbi:MAG: glycosyltransferase family 39 protein [Holosporaceae bacterium]|nr:glycosyltransferase family 39 protein [Holosporaceae bacterium]
MQKNLNFQGCFGKTFLVLIGLLASAMSHLRTHYFTPLFGDLKLRFFDTDDYMMLVRIREFFIHHDFYKTVIDRTNVPYGGDIHWTRFYDLFFIIPVYILNFFLESIDKSIEYVGFFISPVIKIVTIVVIFRLFQNMMDRRSAFVATLIFAIHPAINYINMFGRPDHHAFILLFTICYLYSLALMAESGFKNIGAAARAGIICALCIWISPETLAIILLSEAVLLFSCRDEPEKLTAIYTKTMVTSCCIGIVVFLFTNFDGVDLLCLGSLVAISSISIRKFNGVHLVGLLFLAVAFSTLPLLEYDKISPVHLVLYICLSMCFGICLAGQALVAKYGWYFVLVSAGVIGGLFLYMFPLFLYGMEAQVSEELKTVWLQSNVDELKSPFCFGQQSAVFFCICLLIASLAVYNKMRDLVEKVFDDQDMLWWIFVVAGSSYLVLASLIDRLRATMVFLTIPFAVDMVSNFALKRGEHVAHEDPSIGGATQKLPEERMFRKKSNVFRGLVAVILMMAPDCVYLYQKPLQSYFSNRESIKDFCKARRDAYQQEDRFFTFLDGMSEKPVTILTYLGKASMILYYTKHSVIATPYHRHEQGILTFFAVTEKEYDEKTVKKMLHTAGVDYIFISKSMCYANPSCQNSLARMIADSGGPDWLSVAPIPQEFDDVVLVKVDQKKLAGN